MFFTTPGGDNCFFLLSARIFLVFSSPSGYEIPGGVFRNTGASTEEKKLCGGFVKQEKCTKEMYKKKDFEDGRDKEKDKNPTRKYTKGREREREKGKAPEKRLEGSERLICVVS